MKFGKRYTKGTVFMAMLQGVIIGIAAITIVGFIILGTNGKKVGETPETEVPATGPPPSDSEAPTADGATVEPIKLFARQHGVFSSSASAATFMEENPSLSTAAIVQVGDQHFIWSAVGLTEAEIMDSEGGETFRKAFTANTSSCEVVGAKKMKEVLAAEDLTKIKSLESEKDADKTSVFSQQLTAISTFTSDIRVIRLHLIAHYSGKQDCVKIEF